MDIRNWPMNKIMQLPDWCFGTRYPVGVALLTASGVTGWDISEIGLPERAVLWEVGFWSSVEYTAITSFRLSLGDQLPTTTAMNDENEQLLKGCGRLIAGQRYFNLFGAEVPILTRLKMPYATGGRRLILEIDPDAAKAVEIIVITIWSSMPTEVPNWLISEQGREL